MTATPIVRLDTGKDLHLAVAELLAAADYPQIARWIQLFYKCLSVACCLAFQVPSQNQLAVTLDSDKAVT